jgi:lipoprotein-anchoring transpeptidase ErfK/SrfK
MSKNPYAPRRNPFYLVFAFILICAVVGIAAWTATSSPALSLNIIVTPTYVRQPFALVKIAKPVVINTALPINIQPTIILPPATQALTGELPSSPIDPVALPTDVVLQTSESIVSAEIIVDTPVPGYSNTTQYDTPPSYVGNKYILIDISEQHMYVYEGDTLVYSFVSSTGMNNATRAGSFSVLDKIPNAYGATWDIWMPNWLGIYWAGSMENGIHALPILPNGATLWAGYLGVPISYGCIVLGTDEAQLLYDWADIGTPVEIRR